MTCVIGLERDGVVWLGGDSQTTGGNVKRTRREAKIFKKGPFLIGTAGSVRYNQLLKFKFGPPPHHPPDKDDLEYMVVDVVDAVMTCLEDAGFLYAKDGIKSTGSEDHYAQALFAYRGRLYHFASDFQMSATEDGYDAIGSASDIALGAMYMLTIGVSHPPDHSIRMALEAASHLDAYVGGPFVILSEGEISDDLEGRQYDEDGKLIRLGQQ